MYILIQIHSFHHPLKPTAQFLLAVTSILPTVSSSDTRWQLITNYEMINTMCPWRAAWWTRRPANLFRNI